MAHILNRRSVIKGMAGMTMAPMLAKVMTSEAVASASTPPILVVIEMNGRNDGLNTIVPLSQIGAYAALRPNIGLTQSQVVSPFTAGDGARYGFHPAMSQNLLLDKTGQTPMNGLPSLFKGGSGPLAMVVGTGLPGFDAQRTSHPCAREDWYVGRPNAWVAGGDGWLGRVLDNQPYQKLGPSASTSGDAQILQGRYSSGLAIGSSLASFNMNFYGPAQTAGANYTAWIGATSGGATAMKFSTALDQKTLDDVNLVAGVNGVAGIGQAAPLTDYVYMNKVHVSSLEAQLYTIAQLILGGSGLLGYFASFGSFDTHDLQSGGHASLLSNLSGAMTNFYTYISQNKAKYGIANNVLIMTISDFGRTPHENSAFGTDHGVAGISFILGDGVTGGLHGEYPSLSKLDNYQLAVTVPFQNVISDIVRAIGGSPMEIVGASYPRIGFV